MTSKQLLFAAAAVAAFAAAPATAEIDWTKPNHIAIEENGIRFTWDNPPPPLTVLVRYPRLPSISEIIFGQPDGVPFGPPFPPPATGGEEVWIGGDEKLGFETDVSAEVLVALYANANLRFVFGSVARLLAVGKGEDVVVYPDPWRVTEFSIPRGSTAVLGLQRGPVWAEPGLPPEVDVQRVAPLGAGDEVPLFWYRISKGLSGSAPVPEPASWALMIGGFGVVGGALRRRRAPGVAA